MGLVYDVFSLNMTPPHFLPVPFHPHPIPPTQAGPQLTLYVPGPMLRVGVNTVTLLELHQQPQGDSLSLTWADRMNWGPIDPPPPSKG